MQFVSVNDKAECIALGSERWLRLPMYMSCFCRLSMSRLAGHLFGRTARTTMSSCESNSHTLQDIKTKVNNKGSLLLKIRKLKGRQAIHFSPSLEGHFQCFGFPCFQKQKSLKQVSEIWDHHFVLSECFRTLSWDYFFRNNYWNKFCMFLKKEKRNQTGCFGYLHAQQYP